MDVIIIDKKSIIPLNINDDDIYIGLEDINKETGVINTLRSTNEFNTQVWRHNFPSLGLARVCGTPAE